MATSSNLQKWLGRLKFIRGEYPFGPIEKTYDDEGRLHSETKPAYISPTRITWYVEGRRNGVDADIFGSISYYFKDILVPPQYVLNPESVTFNEIIKHKNSEVRRIGLEIYGFERMIKEKKLKEIHSHELGTLYKANIKNLEEPVVVVQVTDATDVPGIGHRKYILQVPPNMKRADEAVAWTFRKSVRDYHPQQES